jgi:hypothetical protein
MGMKQTMVTKQRWFQRKKLKKKWKNRVTKSGTKISSRYGKKGNAKWGGGEFIRWLNSCFVREKERINKWAYL